VVRENGSTSKVVHGIKNIGGKGIKGYVQNQQQLVAAGFMPALTGERSER